jgi:hypothetical protein
MALDKESLITLICKHSEFYKKPDKDLECGAYKILKNLMNFLFNGKSIRQEKDRGKEKSRNRKTFIWPLVTWSIRAIKYQFI